MYKIGCDVGGTNTDAALLDVTKIDSDSKGVLATCKTLTTVKVIDGIRTAIETVLLQSQIDRREVFNVAVGTTHFVNAVVENDSSRLQKVACVRLCGPYTRSVSVLASCRDILMFTESTILGFSIRIARYNRRSTLLLRWRTRNRWTRDQASQSRADSGDH